MTTPLPKIAEVLRRKRTFSSTITHPCPVKGCDNEMDYRDRVCEACLLAAADALDAVGRLRDHATIVVWPGNGAYPIEHNMHAGHAPKDCWDEVVAAVAALAEAAAKEPTAPAGTGGEGGGK